MNYLAVIVGVAVSVGVAVIVGVAVHPFSLGGLPGLSLPRSNLGNCVPDTGLPFLPRVLSFLSLRAFPGLCWGRSGQWGEGV